MSYRPRRAAALATGNGAATVYMDDGERAMPRSVPPLRRLAWRSSSPGLTGCPTGKSGSRLTAVPLRLGSRQRVEPMLQAHGLPVDFGISEIVLDGGVEAALLIRPSRPTQRGGSRSSRTRGGMRWTQAALKTRALACGRRRRVVLTPRRWRQVGGSNSAGDGGKRARSPGRARNKP